MEYDFTKVDGERAVGQIARAVKHRAALQRVFRAYLKDDGVPPALGAELQRFASEPAEEMPPRPERAPPGRYSFPPYGSWALELLFRLDRDERWLCEARTLMMKLAQDVAPPAEVRADFDAQAEAHRRHREEDLAAVRTDLENALAGLRVIDPKSAEKFIRLQDKLARANALTVEEILADREILEPLWPNR